MPPVSPDPTPFLPRLAAADYAWGGINCATAIGTYLQWALGLNRDPAEDWIGAVADEAEARAMLRRKGGLPAVMAREARALGLPRAPVDGLAAGDVAIVRYRPLGGEERHHGAIVTRTGRMAIKCNDGVVLTRNVRTVAAWRAARA